MNASATECSDRLLRLPEVRKRVGLGKTMIYELIANGRFPRPYKITPAAARWSEREIEEWIERVKGAPSTEAS
jgi:prophage regulatory protein